MVAEPDAIQEVLVRKFDNFRNRGVSESAQTQIRYLRTYKLARTPHTCILM